jgi:hypothetical protein
MDNELNGESSRGGFGGIPKKKFFDGRQLIESGVALCGDSLGRRGSGAGDDVDLDFVGRLDNVTSRRLIQAYTMVALIRPSVPVPKGTNRSQKSEWADAWSPEAQEHDLGRRCLAAILSQPGWTVRVLTKNDAVANKSQGSLIVASREF